MGLDSRLRGNDRHSVIFGEAKNLCGSKVQKQLPGFFSRDCGLRMTKAKTESSVGAQKHGD
jgi:hypothetical protein